MDAPPFPFLYLVGLFYCNVGVTFFSEPDVRVSLRHTSIIPGLATGIRFVI